MPVRDLHEKAFDEEQRRSWKLKGAKSEGVRVGLP